MKRIAIYADSFNGKVGQSLAYMNFVGLFGIPRLVTPQDDPQEIVDSCDALVIPGGADVNPLRYGQVPHPATGRANAYYECMDITIASKFIEAKKPIVGICRGMQSLNVMFGGTLYQHIKGHTQGSDRTATNQTLFTPSGKNYKVNTIHHQAVQKLGTDLEMIGATQVVEGCNSLYTQSGLVSVTGKDDKGKDVEFYAFVEAFKHKTLPIVAFQYHPEEFNCPFAIQEINKVLNPVIQEENEQDRQEVPQVTEEDTKEGN